MSNLKVIFVTCFLLIVLILFGYRYEVLSPQTTISSSYKYGQKTTTNPMVNYFQPTMSTKQKADMLSLLKLFKKQMDRFNIAWFLFAGSLIGVHRHHGFIPWDDDIDILVESSKKEELKKAIGELNKTHALKSYGGKETSKWKFYALNGKKISHKPFRYPYLDLFFYRDYNDTTFYIELEGDYLSKSQILPLVDRIFEGNAMPTPCDTGGMLKTFYGNIDVCSSPSWNHSMEYGITHSQQKTVKCSLLKTSFPFVERRMERLKAKLYFTEILKQGQQPLQNVSYSMPLVCSGKDSYYQSNVVLERL